MTRWEFLCALQWCRHQLPQFASVILITCNFWGWKPTHSWQGTCNGRCDLKESRAAWHLWSSEGLTLQVAGSLNLVTNITFFWKRFNRGASKSIIFCQCFFNHLGRFAFGLGWTHCFQEKKTNNYMISLQTKHRQWQVQLKNFLVRSWLPVLFPADLILAAKSSWHACRYLQSSGRSRSDLRCNQAVLDWCGVLGIQNHKTLAGQWEARNPISTSRRLECNVFPAQDGLWSHWKPHPWCQNSIIGKQTLYSFKNHIVSKSNIESIAPPNQNKIYSSAHSWLSQMSTIHLDVAHQVVFLQGAHLFPDLRRLRNRELGKQMTVP